MDKLKRAPTMNTTHMKGSTAMDLNAYKRHHEAVYGPHIRSGAYPADALINLHTESNRRGFHIPLNDPERAYRLASNLMQQPLTRTGGVHMRVVPMENREYSGTGEGRYAIAWPALMMDWDTCDGDHALASKKSDLVESGPFAGLPLPTRRQIRALIDEVLPDSFRINTGGGFQSIFALETPLDCHAPETKDLLLRLQQRWFDEAKARGFALDTSVGVLPVQNMRIAGSQHKKYNGRTVDIVKDEPIIYSAASLAEGLPELRTKTRERATRASLAGGATFRTGFNGKAFAKSFAKAVPVTWMLEGVWDMELKGSDDAEYMRYIFPREDGSLSTSDSHVSVKTGDDGIQRAHAMAARVQDEFGVASNKIGLTSWDLLTIILGSPVLAETMAKMYKKPSDDLLDGLRELNEARHSPAAA